MQINYRKACFSMYQLNMKLDHLVSVFQCSFFVVVKKAKSKI